MLPEHICCNLIYNFVMLIWYIIKNIICHFKKPCNSYTAASIYAHKLICLRIHGWVYKYFYKILCILRQQSVCINKWILMPEIIQFIMFPVIIYHPRINCLSEWIINTFKLFNILIAHQCLIIKYLLLMKPACTAYKYTCFFAQRIITFFKYFFIFFFIKDFFYLVINTRISYPAITTSEPNNCIRIIHVYVALRSHKFIITFIFKLVMPDFYTCNIIAKAIYLIYVSKSAYEIISFLCY